MNKTLKLEITFCWFEDADDSNKVFLGAKWDGDDKWGEKSVSVEKPQAAKCFDDLLAKLKSRLVDIGFQP